MHSIPATNRALQPSIQGKILITNLHELTDDNILYDTFSIFGNIFDCKVVIDEETGKSKGYAYVHYTEDTAARKASEGINGLTICGCKIKAHLLNIGDEIALWLTNKVGLPQYINLFLEHGVEDMETVQLLDINDIRQEIGITNIKHLDRIMQCIEKFNRQEIMQQFAVDIDNFINLILPNHQETLIRQSMFQYITDCVSDLQAKLSATKHSNNIRLKACKFGSELWNVSCRGSDLDVAIAVNFKNFRNDKQKLLDDLLQIITENNSKQDIDGSYVIHADYAKLLNATYPIVRLQHKIWKIEMDISVADRYCIPTNLYILRCIDKYHKIAVRELIIFVKYWSKQRAINDSYNRYLNSFGYTMMVINYLQHLNDFNGNTLSDLIYGFFEFYATKFNFDRYSISITKCRNTDSFIKKYGSDPIEIIDPMKEPDKEQLRSYNVARRVGYYQRYHIIAEFNRAYTILMHSKQAVFAQLMKDDIEGADRNVYVAFIPPHWNGKTLKTVFEQNTGGKIVNFELWRDENAAHGMCACVTFESLEYVNIAIERLNATLQHGHNGQDVSNLYVCRAHKRQFENRQILNLTVKVGAKCSLYVGCLSAQVDEAKLSQIFRQFGQIVSICVIRDVGGRSKGYGFVAFDNKESATKAITMTGTMHYGQGIHVAHAHGKKIDDIDICDEKDALDDVELTLDMLSEAKPAERKRLIGERLFPKIQAIAPKLAAEILRVLLEMDNTELLVLLSQQNILMDVIHKTLTGLRKSAIQ